MAMFVNPKASGMANLVLHVDAVTFRSANSAVNGDRWENLSNNRAFFYALPMSGDGAPPYVTYSGNYGNTRSYITFFGNNSATAYAGGSTTWSAETNLTVEVIVRVREFASSMPLAEKIDGSIDGWALRANSTVNGGNPGFEWVGIASGSESGVSTNSRIANVGDWYYIQAVISGASSNPWMTLKVNGRIEGHEQIGQTIQGTDPAYLTFLGSSSEAAPPSAPYANVDVNMIRVYDRALSNAELDNNWQSFRTRMGPPEANGFISWES